MKAETKRLIGSLLIPPFLGASLLYGLEVAIDDLSRRSFAGHIELFLGYSVYSLIFCLIPGFCYWAILEFVRRKKPTWATSSSRYVAVGAVLGGIAGFAFAVVLGGERRWGDFLHLVPIGLVVGLTTAGICRGLVDTHEKPA
jgi:hypothetical protein